MGLLDNIKKEAQGNKTKIQTTDATVLDGILNKLFYAKKKIEDETAFVKYVMTRGAETEERVGLHASSMLVGDKEFCVRQQVLSLIYKQRQGEDVAIRWKRVFEEGNVIHEKWQRLFIRGGYATADKCDHTNYDEEGMMYFTPDIIATIPEWYDEEFVVEIKSVNTYQFQKMLKHPSGWKQCQWYMHKKGLKRGIVLCEDKNTQEFKVEVYDYDPKLVAPYVERQEEIVFHHDRVFEEGRMVARPKDATSPSCKRCANCHMLDACWNVGMGKIKFEDNWG